MPRPVTVTPTLLSRVRQYFRIKQPDLALYLGVSSALIGEIEGRRRNLTSDVLHALLPLAKHLPPVAPEDLPAETTPAPALPEGSPAPDAFVLDVRRRVCLQNAARLRAQLDRLTMRAVVAQRWAEALPELLAASAAPPDADEAAMARAAWLARWLPRQARPLTTEQVTQWHRLRARIAALEAEAAALAG